MTQPNLYDLINIDGYGNAAKELQKSGHWDYSDITATKDNPVEINIKCTGFSVTEHDNIVTISAH